MDILNYIIGWAVTTTGQFHLTVAIIGLLIGPITFYFRKGSFGHRWAGYLFIVSMLITNLTALLSYNLTGGINLFHFTALVSLSTVLAAIFYLYKALIAKSEKYFIIHGILMSWTYFGLVAAFITEVFTRAFPTMLHGDGGWMRLTLSLTLFLMVTGWFVHKITSRIIPKIIKSSSKGEG